jgi:hypothetical protein
MILNEDELGGAPSTHLGILNIKSEGGWGRARREVVFGNVGTTAEICSADRHGGESRGPSFTSSTRSMSPYCCIVCTGSEGLVLKARGRHRFRVLKEGSHAGALSPSPQCTGAGVGRLRCC